MVVCPKCLGVGAVQDPRAQGRRLRLKRKQAQKGLSDTAKKMGISASYLHDLEVGGRPWSPDLVAKFIKAIQ